MYASPFWLTVNPYPARRRSGRGRTSRQAASGPSPFQRNGPAKRCVRRSRPSARPAPSSCPWPPHRPWSSGSFVRLAVSVIAFSWSATFSPRRAAGGVSNPPRQLLDRRADPSPGRRPSRRRPGVRRTQTVEQRLVLPLGGEHFLQHRLRGGRDRVFVGDANGQRAARQRRGRRVVRFVLERRLFGAARKACFSSGTFTLSAKRATPPTDTGRLLIGRWVEEQDGLIDLAVAGRARRSCRATPFCGRPEASFDAEHPFRAEDRPRR